MLTSQQAREMLSPSTAFAKRENPHETASKYSLRENKPDDAALSYRSRLRFSFFRSEVNGFFGAGAPYGSQPEMFLPLCIGSCYFFARISGTSSGCKKVKVFLAALVTWFFFVVANTVLFAICGFVKDPNVTPVLLWSVAFGLMAGCFLSYLLQHTRRSHFN